MEEVDVKKLFLVIQNAYNNFYYDDVKVAVWRDFLQDTPFELAQNNLRAHIMYPKEFPPTPGQLARRPEQEAQGPYIPGVEETRKILAKMEEDAAKSLDSPVPEHLRGRFKLEPPRIESTTS